MRDRLIELMKKTVVGVENGHKVLAETIWLPRVFEAMADRLLANGVIVPPCKVGQTVYSCLGNAYQVVRYVIKSCSPHITIILESGLNGQLIVDETAFGKTVFLTREEAEKALAERSNENAE